MNSNISQLINLKYPLLLASQSPRRRFLLSLLGLEFDVTSVEINEDKFASLLPSDIVCELAERKAIEASKLFDNHIIITADTLVFLDNEVLTKPTNREDAYRILKLLSGRTHQVYTGIAIFDPKTKSMLIEFEKTDVTIRNLEDEEIWGYINSGSPMDKAGAYGIQDDFGAVFVERVEGDYYNVVGLPLCKLYKMLKKME